MENIYLRLEQIDAVDLYSDYSYNRNIISDIGNERDNFTKKDDAKNAKLCQIEIDTLNFSTNDNTISCVYSGTDKEGNPFEYPSLKDFTSDDFKYLNERLNNTNNLYLKARYSHILWHSPQKRIIHATIAADSYFEIAKLLHQQIGSSDNSSLRVNITNTLENAVLISSNLKDKTILHAIKVFFLAVVQDFSRKEELFINTSLISFMLENKKIFKRADFTGLEHKIYDAAQNKEGSTRIDVLKLGQKIDLKLGSKSLYWDKEIAECYESLSIEREDGSNMISTHFAQEAVKHYKAAKEGVKTKELTSRYEYLKKNLKLGKFSTEIDLTEIMKFVNDFSDNLSSMPPEQILSALMYDKNILPSYAETEKQAEEQKRNHPLQFHCVTSIYDGNGHVAEYFSTDEESMYHAILHNFDMSIKLCRGYLLRDIFFKGVSKGNISASSFTSFLRNRTWLGQDISRTFTQGESETYNWLNLIMPAINDYLVQIHFYLTNQTNHINLTLCIDSLAVKIEGILRDMVTLGGGSSFFFTEDKAKRSIAREKDINALLREDVITKLISKDDLLFLKFLLVEKAGFNLRNKVSHSLFRHPQNYSLVYMNLLIVAILRLAKDEYYPLKDQK